MPREFYPHVNDSGATECAYAGCGKDVPADHYLCVRHYAMHQDGRQAVARQTAANVSVPWSTNTVPTARGRRRNLTQPGRPATRDTAPSTPTSCSRAASSTPATPGTCESDFGSIAAATAWRRRRTQVLNPPTWSSSRSSPPEKRRRSGSGSSSSCYFGTGGRRWPSRSISRTSPAW